jgi:hypothetical protein
VIAAQAAKRTTAESGQLDGLPAARRLSAWESFIGDDIMRALILAAAAGALVAVTPLSAANAANPEFCRGYARAALNQVESALAVPECRRGLEGARWSADYRVHFDWCLGASPAAAESERGIRTGYLRGCRLR